MTIKELFKNLSRYDENTRLDFMYINHVESDSQFEMKSLIF